MIVALLVLSYAFHLRLLILAYLKTFSCHTFWESHSFHTSQNSQFRITCTSSSPGFSRHLHVYTYTFNFLHYWNSTTLLASHTYWKLRTWLFLLPQNWSLPAKYLEVLRYLLQYLLTVIVRGLRHASWSILSTVFFGLCRHKLEVLLISHACSLHFVHCKFVFIYICSPQFFFLWLSALFLWPID